MPNYFKNFHPYPAQRIGISAVIYMHTYIYIICSQMTNQLHTAMAYRC